VNRRKKSAARTRQGDWIMIYKIAAKIEKYILKLIHLENTYPPVFLVGVPRSGTTVVYLHLVNAFKFSYFPNISNKYSDAVLFSSLWGRLFYRYKPTYQSRYGIIEGYMAPCDGWEIFHRWFPRYDLSTPVNSRGLYELKNIVKLLEILFHAPFINKNNNNGVRIDYLSELFPNSIFIYIKRNIPDTVSSILEGRKNNNIRLKDWWGAVPPRFYNKEFSSELEKVVCQVWDVNNYIKETLEKIPAARRIEVSYEKFCKNPTMIREQIKEKYLHLGVKLKKRKQHIDSDSFIKYKKKKHPGSMEKEINRILNTLHNSNQGK
jgi:hypothetical protein